ncbi:MAG: hypothetical protein HYW57_05070 [Ignavibacteriales bacterium]|nr:hypothetical protein [Ignavibacteriales bacterium]
MDKRNGARDSLPDLSLGARTIHTPIPLVIKILTVLVFSLFMTPVLMYLAWFLTPASPYSVLVIDKTSIDQRGVERSSFYWTMKHRKITKGNGAFYLPSIDYRGFVPLRDTMYLVTGLEGLGESEIDSLASHFDAAYYIDTYGVSAAEWTTKIPEDDPSRRLYGGLANEDLLFLTMMRNRGKPILSEFNLMASPTSDTLRQRTQELLGLQWTGWTGRYFATLDTVANPDFPLWILLAYEKQYGTQWEYRLPGVILVHLDGRLIVLEAETYLLDAMPTIVTAEDVADYFGVPAEIPYPFWFDVTFPDQTNTVISTFVLRTNQYGDSLLASLDLPREFPAAIIGKQAPTFYYFCMDASDNPEPPEFFARFTGIEWLRWLFYDPNDLTNRRRFFWEYYLPMMSQILDELKNERPSPGRAQP